MDQIIHYVNVPKGVCSRKDTKEDDIVETYNGNELKVTFFALANYTGNVTCKRCKQWMKANQNRRAAMITGKREHHAVR